MADAGLGWSEQLRRVWRRMPSRLGSVSTVAVSIALLTAAVGGAVATLPSLDRGRSLAFDIDRIGSINHQHGTAIWGILIGEKDCWNKGYGTETARLMLDYAFTALSLTNVLLTVYSYNTRGIRAYLRAGYKEIGRRRGARRFAGGVYDEVYMDCIASEFESPVLRSLLAP